MSSKVKCTCGWSWNKSDSSKKDMYVCHECGRDNSNNMKDGGWLDNYGKEDNYNDYNVSAPEGFEGDGYSNVGRNSSPAWGGQFQTGGKLKFLQPTSEKLPEGYRIPYSDPSSERAMSIGGENGEPAYLIPSFKYGKPLYNAAEEFRNTGEHLGGPFETYEEADKWEKETRHPAVERKENIMFPQEQFQMGGSIPGAVGNMYARTGAPSEGKYAKKTLPSAQNGQEMKYYQEGLDWQPKTISKNGAWLDSYDKAQGGTNLPSVRDLITDTTNRKIQAHKGKGKDTAVTKKDNTKTVTPKEFKKLSGRQQNELAKKQSEEQARKDWVQGSMEEAYKSPLMSPGYFTPEGVAIGALQGATKMGPDLHEGNYKGAAMDALMMLPLAPSAIKTATPLIQKAGKALGTEEGLLSNAYKYNPLAFKPNPEAYYHRSPNIENIINKEKQILQGFGESEVGKALTEKALRPTKGINLMKGANSQLYFAKGVPLDYGRTNKIIDYKTGNLIAGHGYPGPYMAEVKSVPMGASTKGKPPGADVTNIGGYAVPRRPINVNEAKFYKQHWLQGYKEVPKQEDGGIIKDDRGQWDHPGEITEIGSNDITMEGVPYDVLGISDTGDTKLMKPGKNYKFKGKKVTEYPMAKDGLRQEQKGLQNLDNLTNFTNYNKPTIGGWLNKYN